EGGWNDAWSDVASFLPKLAAFLVILIIGWFVAKALAKATDLILERVGFDRAVERGGVAKALEHSRYDASDIAAKLVFYAVLLFTLQMAFGVFGPNPVSELLSDVIAWLPQAFVAIVIIVVASAIASAVKDIVGNTLGGLSYGRLLANLASAFILALGIIAALAQVGIATAITTPILIAVLATIAGVIIVGVGGGLVQPMQRVWAGWIQSMAEESTKVRREIDLNRMSRESTAVGAGTPTGESPTQNLPPTRPMPGDLA
ncbi:MAG TPA: hypothetical protein VFX15_10155, partial [Actinomycetes bacterium]|nr:hypothetical protein [Actinomycetes bacterium]